MGFHKKLQPLIHRFSDVRNIVNTGDATATADKIITGYTAYVNGAKLSGTGKESTDFYKCASVGSGTWTGYKAVQNSTTKIWSYESSLTSDTLTFDSTKVTPEVGSVYTADALIQADLYEGWVAPSGAIFYEPFTADVSAAQTGQSYTKTGTLTFAADSSLGCNVATFDGSSHLVFPFSDMPYGSDPWSISAWVYNTNSTGYGWASPLFAYGTGESSYYGRMLWIGTGTSVTTIGTHGSGTWSIDSAESAVTANTWCHVAITYDGSTAKIYVNSVCTASTSHTFNTQQFTNAAVGAINTVDSDVHFTGKMSSYRIYARALTQAEVTKLYNEHTVA